MRLPDEPEMPTQISILPTIYVIFAILTFFIISKVYLTRSEGLPVNLPTAGTAQSQKHTLIAITIDEQGNLAKLAIATKQLQRYQGALATP
ncbi:MAG: biopolymer transporter ExbD [Chroococcus sp. CMT-3BRIN-NPC107]|jgi:biopolymer transport protein ExbD|nr:biopolymer transporter ExbD [Chroococcus sp. CMT-3BRIN-NPC107]